MNIMHKIIQFTAKWIVPIGFVQLLANKNDNLFSKDSVGNQTYWRSSQSKKNTGADILIRRS